VSTADELMAVIRMYAKNPTPHNEFKVRATLTDFLPYADQEPIAPELQSIEQYRMQMSAISTAAIGYWKEGDGIHSDYDTVALRDVARLYAKYGDLHAALENVRLYAARYRKEEWAKTILRLCEEGGAVSSPLRAEAKQAQCVTELGFCKKHPACVPLCDAAQAGARDGEPFASGSLPPLPEPCNKGQSLVGGIDKPWEPLFNRHQMYEYARQSVYLIDQELLCFAQWLLDAYHSDEGMPEAKEIAKEARAVLALKGEKE
jgi:hypothetical protein